MLGVQKILSMFQQEHDLEYKNSGITAVPYPICKCESHYI